MKKIILGILLLTSQYLIAQINQAKVYWVGHSLISHTDSYSSGTDNLMGLMATMASSQGKTYSYHDHTTPGAPIGWNWGANMAAWNDIETLIQPLLNSSHTDYGTYDVMIVTESIDLHPAYQWWVSSFYARKFYNAAKTANPNARLFLYESWHHFHASDDGFRSYYGPISTFDWNQYMLNVRPLWEMIIDRASDPAMTQNDAGYVYQGPGIDPGLGNDILEINIIPTGQVLVNVLNRLALNLGGDDWTYNGSPLTALDFFANPLANFPTDTVTTVHPDPVDDIHPSNVLIYLNALVHYAVVYQDNPINLPPANGVPANIADIFKEVVWNVVSTDPRTGIPAILDVEYLDPFNARIVEDQVKLSWSTASERNSQYFEIERATDIGNWEKIGRIKAKNNSNTKSTYTAIDNSPLEGTSYYRLKQIDFDDSFSYSNVASIYFINPGFSIHPNPATTILHIEAKGNSKYNIKNSSYQIRNSIGAVVLEGKEKTINIAHLPKGVYFINFGELSKKFIKD